jgi:cytochrome c
MSARHYLIAGIAILASGTFDSARAQGSPQRGAKIYGTCVACHSLEPNLHLTGPSLAGLWGKKAASVADFPRYSPALKERDFVWDGVTLNAWIADPKAFVAGNSMTFRGISDDKARGDLVAFLKLALAPNGAKAVVAQGLIRAELARGQAPEPLETAGPDERVTAARHCQNTFFIVTADGKERPFWELNLRLKVDSGATGPKDGTPVLVPAGMQGDRASLVFSDPTQISSFIEQKC